MAPTGRSVRSKNKAKDEENVIDKYLSGGMEERNRESHRDRGDEKRDAKRNGKNE